MNKHLTTKQDTSLVLSKSKSTLSITKRILSGDTSLSPHVVKEWIQNIWKWAEVLGVAEQKIPRDKNKLLGLTTLDFYNIGLGEFPKELCQLENITTLILWDNNLRELPLEIVNFIGLQKINLRGNPLSLTSNQIRWLDALKENGCTVYIDEKSSDDYLVVKDEIDYKDVMTNVEFTNASELIEGNDSWMERLWDWADKSDVQEFGVDENDWYSRQYPICPRDEEGLLKLTGLFFRKQWITELPAEIGNLTHLKSINVSANRITRLPKEIFNIINLERLLLSENMLISLQKEIGQLTSLEYLSLGKNNLSILPKEIGKLTSLEHLSLNENNLSILPKEIGKLTSLEHLSLNENNLSILPKEIGELTSLEGLSISVNKLKKLPKEIGNLKNIRWISAYRNDLIELPQEIGTLVNLRELDLSSNKLKEFPTEICNLVNLSRLRYDQYLDYTLTYKQKKWIETLMDNGCKVER